MHPTIKKYPSLIKYRHPIILILGFATACLFALGYLPQTTSWSIPYKDKLNIIYAFVIGLTGIFYYLMYVAESPKPGRPSRPPPSPVGPPMPPRPQMETPIPPTMETPIVPPKPKGIMEQVGDALKEK